jgi:fructokinase
MQSEANKPLVVGIGEVLWDLLPEGRQLGGAPANFAYHAHCLGTRGLVASCVGDDDAGRDILAQLGTAGLETDYLAVDARRPTGTVSVTLDANGSPTYTIHEKVAWDFIPTSPQLLSLARQTNAVCFGTLAQRSPISRATILGFLDETCADCLRVFDVNLRQDYYEAPLIEHLLELSGVVKMNDAELPRVAEMLHIADGAPRDMLRELVWQFDLDAVALTRGDRGSLLVSAQGVSDHPGVQPARIVDTVGAGDSFTAAFVVGLLHGDPLDRINERANRLAALVCARPGGMAPIDSEYRAICDG